MVLVGFVTGLAYAARGGLSVPQEGVGRRSGGGPIQGYTVGVRGVLPRFVVVQIVDGNTMIVEPDGMRWVYVDMLNTARFRVGERGEYGEPVQILNPTTMTTRAGIRRKIPLAVPVGYLKALSGEFKAWGSAATSTRPAK